MKYKFVPEHVSMQVLFCPSKSINCHKADDVDYKDVTFPLFDVM